MKTFSEELREARQAKGLTLEELAAATKISLKVLKAMETGDFEVLPQTYIKGFLRTYAREVGLDAAAIVKAFEAQKEAAAEIFLHPPRIEKKTSRRSPWLFVGSVVGLCLILFAGYYVLSTSVPQRRPVQGIPVEDTIPLSSPETDPIQPEPENTDTVVPPVEREGAAENHGGITRTEDTTPPPPLDPKLDRDQPQDVHEALAASEPTELTLAVEALSDTWMRVLADGVRVYEGIMRVQSTASWEAESLFELKIGKAAGVRLFLNGQSLGDLGTPDQVVSELVLDKNGVVKKTLR